MSLIKYWPSEKDCLACIKPEAENPSDAVFLAVHQEIRLLRKSFSSESSVQEPKSQQKFLRAFLRDDPSGRVIFPILGESGIGKSHLVRWLDVQLRQRDDSEKRHVIRIPKSSSLKSVLGRILNGLEGPRYEKIRQQLQSAREQMDDISAKQRVRAELLSAIHRNFEAASVRRAKAKSAGPKISLIDELWLRHGDPRKLPALFDDPATQKLFLVGTRERPGIISELARHVTKDTSEAESPRRQFEAKDFEIPKELEKELSEAGPIASSYLRNQLLMTTSTKSRDEAVELLNGIVDDAIAPLATPQDTSLSELFYEVRRQLLADGRELVLLVEDFAVLAGVQKALLDAIIREGEVSGKQEACMIRTALAVTDGYFGNLETVKTRAVHGWWIESGENADESEIENSIGDFVATYVNAARVGVDRLEKFYSVESNAARPAPDGVELIGAEDEDVAMLNGFEKSASGYSLFPFNQSAIRTIADWKLRDARGMLRFHPRSIINEVILPVLKEYRSEYERNSFPPENFLGYPLRLIDSDLSTELTNRISDRGKRSRYLYLLQFWGDKPTRVADAKISTAIFKAMVLEPLIGGQVAVTPAALRPVRTDGASSATASIVTHLASSVAPQVTIQEADDLPAGVKDFIGRIDTWRSGGVLGQADANTVRRLINIHVLNSVNWEAELLREVKPATDTYANRIFLPNARGNPPDKDKAFIVAEKDELFADADVANRVFRAVRAMIRYDHHGNWNYKESDDDYIDLQNFVEPLAAQAIEWVRTHYKNVEGDPVPSLAQSLLWQARILNIDCAHRDDDASCIKAIFAGSPVPGERDDDEKWNSFLDEMNERRRLLVAELVERLAAFQGTGKTPYAIDASQLLATVQEFRNNCAVTQEFPKLPDSHELKQIELHVSMLKKSGVKYVEDRKNRILEQSRAIINELGAEYDKSELIHDLDEVCNLAEQNGLSGRISVGEVRELSKKFRKAAAKEVGEQVATLSRSTDTGKCMTAIASLDIKTHSFLVDFTATCRDFLKEVSKKAEGKISDWGDEVVENATQSVDSVLSDLENAVTPYAEPINDR